MAAIHAWVEHLETHLPRTEGMGHGTPKMHMLLSHFRECVVEFGCIGAQSTALGEQTNPIWKLLVRLVGGQAWNSIDKQVRMVCDARARVAARWVRRANVARAARDARVIRRPQRRRRGRCRR